jgi:hypothetical protein
MTNEPSKSRATFGRMTKLHMKSVEDEIEEEMSSEEDGHT